ncbi:hypothetical protein D9615_002302 [Tricholomella constricta]|uniref:Uncharacterized protein n=1 Tax=Tricholomella constricta TaxID=117010 RepID=A0A8H5HN19_9AGAR|nr:hypothetical protein D9615_002302 [Tricholomella constricta]
MGAKFLCCLPLRLGVLVIAFIQFIITGAAAGLVWWLLIEKHNESQLTKKLKASIVLIGVVYTGSALVSLTGLIGALAKKLGAIKTYLFVLYATLGFQVAVTVFTLINYYRLRGTSGPDCNVTSGDTTVNLCEEYVKVPQGAIIVSVIVPILIQAYACYIVAAYKNRLIKQRQDRSSVAMKTPVNPAYTSVPATDQSLPPSYSNTAYPYASAPNAFGAKEFNHNGGHQV